MNFSPIGCLYWILAFIITARMGGGYLIIDVCEAGEKNCHVNDSTLKEFVKIGNKMYFLSSSNGVNWFTAYNECRKHGAYLASFDSEEEFNAVQAYLKNKDKTGWLWIGFNNLGGGEHYSAATGGSGYFKWNEYEPNNVNGTENCVHLFHTNLMNDMDCKAKFQFICEITPPKVISFTIW